MVPKISNSVPARNGQINLPAFCSDMNREWPVGKIKHVFWGGNETIVRLKVGGKEQIVTLNKAVANQWVSIAAGAKSVNIKAAGTGIKLVDIRTSGFFVGQVNEVSSISMADFLEQMNTVEINILDDANYIYYYRYQQRWWRAVYAAEKNNALMFEKRMKEIVSKYFVRKGLETVIKDGNRIVVYDKGSNLRYVEDFYAYEKTNLYQLRRLHIEEYDEWEICLHFDPADSSLISLTIAGKLQNVIPFEVEYNPSGQVAVTTSIHNIELSPGISLEGEIAICAGPAENITSATYPFKKCEIKLGGDLCYPSGISFDAEVCGIAVSFKPKAFGFLRIDDHQ